MNINPIIEASEKHYKIAKEELYKTKAAILYEGDLTRNAHVGKIA